MAHTLLVRIAAVGAICSLGLIDTCTHNGEAAITAAQQSKLPALEPGQVREDILPAGTVMRGSRSSTWKMRAPDAVARWARPSVTPSERIGVISMLRYR